MYRRLLVYLRPHSWRMAGNIASNLIAAGLDAFSFTLLIPFLNALFQQESLLPRGAGWVADLQERTVGALLDPANPRGSLGAMIVAIMIIVAVKNVFVWLAGQFGAARIQISGHTDASMRGTADESLVRELSTRRANAVKEELVNKYKMNPNQFVVAGYGWDKPADPKDPDNHAKNRRVEIKVVPAEAQ